MNRKQRQEGGDHSINVQAGEIHMGLSLRDVKEIALDVFHANFEKLAGIARQIADERVNDFAEKFIRQLQERNPDGLESANDPDMQYVLFEAEKQYARSGDEQQADVLVDLLVDRTKVSGGSLMQIVLNESIGVVGKLTQEQLAALSTAFLIRYAKYLGLTSLATLSDWLTLRICPFVDSLVKNDACYQHIEYANCGTVAQFPTQIHTLFSSNYPGVFSRGFDHQTVRSAHTELDPTDEALFMPCLHDPTKIQVAAVDEAGARQKAHAAQMSPDATKAYVQTLLINHVLLEPELRRSLMVAAPCMATLFDVWENSPLQNLALTSVGIAIAAANIRRVTGHEFDLSIWIH